MIKEKFVKNVRLLFNKSVKKCEDYNIAENNS